jgi:hypothetical protein
VVNLAVVGAYMFAKYQYGQAPVLIYAITALIFFPLLPQMAGSVIYMLHVLIGCCCSFGVEHEPRPERKWQQQGTSYAHFQSRRHASFRTGTANPLLPNEGGNQFV